MTRITPEELSRDIAEFLEFKHALGYTYQRSEATLCNFQRFAERYFGNDGSKCAVIELEPTINAWLSCVDGRKAVTASLYLGVVRQLCLYRQRRDPDSFVPDHALAPQSESSYFPYIFSQEEVHQLLTAARAHQGRNIWSRMLHTLILILYCTGLRFGEAVRLRIADVDLSQALFLIRESKGRTRFVPFGADLAEQMEAYMEERAHIESATDCSESDAFFIRRDGTPLTVKSASEAVRLLLRKLGLKPARGRRGPRPYDFRHAYAVHRLTDWYHGGVDVHSQLPWLSATWGMSTYSVRKFTCTPHPSCCSWQVTGSHIGSIKGARVDGSF